MRSCLRRAVARVGREAGFSLFVTACCAAFLLGLGVDVALWYGAGMALGAVALVGIAYMSERARDQLRELEAQEVEEHDADPPARASASGECRGDGPRKGA